MKIRSAVLSAFFLLFMDPAFGQIGRKLIKVDYNHSTVGTTAQDAILATSVDKKVKGWAICHDAGSAANYLSISDTADPDVDGVRIAAGDCFDCLECSGQTLIDANVKASAAATGYSVVQFK